MNPSVHLRPRAPFLLSWWAGRVGLHSEVPYPMWMRAFSVQPPSEPGVHLSAHRALQRFMPRARPGLRGSSHFLPRSRRTSSTTSASALRMPPGLVLFIACAPSPCGPPLAVARLAGRHSCDYYGHSVTRQARARQGDPTFTLPYVLARLRHPVRLLQYPDRASLLHPGGLPQVSITLRQGPAPVSGVFPAGGYLHLLETGFQAIQPLPYRAGPPAHRPYAWARLPVSWHAAVPFSLRIQVSHQTHEHLLQSVPATRAILQCASWRTDLVAKESCRACAGVGEQRLFVGQFQFEVLMQELCHALA